MPSQMLLNVWTEQKAREGDDQSLPFACQAAGMLEGELRLLDDLVQLRDDVMLVHFPTRCKDARAR